jgi:hypothetical protein
VLSKLDVISTANYFLAAAAVFCSINDLPFHEVEEDFEPQKSLIHEQPHTKVSN